MPRSARRCSHGTGGSTPRRDGSTRAAAFHAVRLLREATEGSREPALSAARLLGVLGEPLPLYAHLLGGTVTGEVALLGLIDTLLDGLSGRQEPEPFEAALLAFLRESPHLDLVRYLATAIVARRHEALIEALRDGPWPAAARRQAVGDALSLLARQVEPGASS